MYVVNMLIPSCFLVTVDLFSFLLPPQSVDRALFKMTLILGYTVLMLNMNDMLPITAAWIRSLRPTSSVDQSVGSPYPGPFGATSSEAQQSAGGHGHLQSCQCLSSTVEMKPSVRAEQEGSLSSDGSLVELKVLGTELQTVRRLVDKALNQSQSSEEWIQVGLVIDRLLFLLYIGFLLVSFMTIIILWAKSNSIT